MIMNVKDFPAERSKEALKIVQSADTVDYMATSSSHTWLRMSPGLVLQRLYLSFQQWFAGNDVHLRALD